MTDAPSTALDRHLLTITQRPPRVFVRGSGSWLEDERGRRYLDLVQGWAVNSLGHSPALVAVALAAQAGRLLNPGPAYYSRPLLDLAQRLTELSCFDRVFLASSGAEANEGAVKLARRWGQKRKGGAHEVINFHDGFHGRTLAMMSASGKPGWDRLYAPMPTGFAKARLHDIESVRRAVTPATVAVMLEFVQGEAGVHVADPGFVRELRALCTERQLLLIADEIQSGLGRTGQTFACDVESVVPDIYIMGKALGGGLLPVSAISADRDVLGVITPGSHGSTFGGNPLGLAVAREAIRILADGSLQRRSAELGDRMLRRLRAEAPDSVREVRGLGLWAGIEVHPQFAPVRDAALRALDAGVIVKDTHATTLRLAPPLVIDEPDLDHGIDVAPYPHLATPTPPWRGGYARRTVLSAGASSHPLPRPVAVSVAGDRNGQARPNHSVAFRRSGRVCCGLNRVKRGPEPPALPRSPARGSRGRHSDRTVSRPYRRGSPGTW